ncbi:MAG TPA: DUF5678 domain-containing protein [Candidatus Nanoarchaeia archaeon]|nr:DUF5678 domain-containing protein [Candidatus Nanoarchaeia archaeon]
MSILKLFSRNKEIKVSEAKADNLRGEWLAIIEDKIVAHGKSLDKVMATVNKEYSNKKANYRRVPSTKIAMY